MTPPALIPNESPAAEPVVVVPKVAAAVPASNNFFNEPDLQMLAIRWKEANASGDSALAMELLERVIIGSTPMFERWAQHCKYHHTVGLPILVGAAQEKVVSWLLKWDPKKGRLFTYFSKCSKHAFLSQVVIINQYRKRFHSTDDSLEQFLGEEDHEIDKHDLAIDVRKHLESITCRWGDPQEIGALRYLIECVAEEDRNKPAAIRSAAYAWGISLEQSKFFYGWALTAMRNACHAKVRVPVTEQTLFLLSESYSNIVDLLDIVTFEQLRKIFIVHGGTRLKIPTIAHLAKLVSDHRLFLEIQASDMDPDTIAEIAARHKKTARNASEIYEDMVHKLNPERCGEYEVYAAP